MSRNILLGITGSIAAYKSCDLISLLVKAGFAVKTILTTNAQQFVTPLTLETLSKNRVYQNSFSDYEVATDHIALARWANCVCVAPATANFICKFAAGIADDLLLTQLLAFQGKVILAPAMNHAMYDSFQVQEALSRLKSHGVIVVQPQLGELACGEFGIGKLAGPQTIFDTIHQNFVPGPWNGRKVIITGGATRSYLDPVRFLTNSSSGKTAVALANTAKRLGAEVVLILGTNSCENEIADGITLHKVESNQQMLSQLELNIDRTFCLIAAAAPSDFRISPVLSKKLKRGPGTVILELEPEIDILATLAKSSRRPDFLVGFAAETENMLDNALAKLRAKKLDLIVANDVSVPDQVFGNSSNQVTLISRQGEIKSLPRLLKTQIAELLLEYIDANCSHHRTSPQRDLSA